MSEIKPINIKECSSESELYPSSNLLKSEKEYPWTCRCCSDKEATVEFEFNFFGIINRLEIGNWNSAFVEIFVLDITDNVYKPLLLSTPLMSSYDAMKGEGGEKIRSIDANHLIGQTRNRKWKCLKVVCTQPFNKSILYGLSFIRFYGCPWPSDIIDGSRKSIICPKIDLSLLSSSDSASDTWQPGSLFSQRNKQILDVPFRKKSIDTPLSSIPKGSIVETKQSLSENSFVKEVDVINESLSIHDDTNVSRDRECSAIDRAIEKGDKPVSTVHVEAIALSSSDPHDKSQPSISPRKEMAHTNVIELKSMENDDEVLSGVSFVLSGYQNPMRNILRDKGISLGAKYRPFWADGCSHLICAYPNTPKFKEVCGRGIIVNEKWILDCYEEKKLLDWHKYRVGDSPSPIHGDTNRNATKRYVCDEEVVEGPSIAKKRKRFGPDECDTDDEIEMVAMDIEAEQVVSLSLPYLPSIFTNMSFFLYRDFDFNERQRLNRMLRAFGGVLYEYMCPEVQIVLTKSLWNSSFDEALLEFGHLRFIIPDWIDECDQRRCLAPLSPFEVTKYT